MAMKKLYIFVGIIFLFSSCTKETGTINETVILNNSGYDVLFTVCGNHYDVVMSLKNGEEASETREHDSGGAEIFPLESDSIIVIFDNTHIAKYYYESLPDGRSPYNIDSYSMEFLGEKNDFNRYSYTYTITEEDYKRSLTKVK